MSLQCGIVGLPNVGKSTLFNALTESCIPAENYPFCTIEPHIGIVELPDSRLMELGKIYKPQKIVPATVEFTDIAGLVRGASRGEGLGNQFLGQIRQTNAIIHVIRCFNNENVAHVDGSIDPVRDAETIEIELLLADLETLEKRKQKIEKKARTGEKESKKVLSFINQLIRHCADGRRASTFDVDEDLRYILNSFHLLTSKPILYIANVDESEIVQDNQNKHVQDIFDLAKEEGNYAVRICASIEEEIASLPQEEKLLFLSEYNLPEPGLNKVIRSSFKLLGLHTYFTCRNKEVRSWTIPLGTSVLKAAGQIHTDFERGFIKAEVFNYNHIIAHGSEKALADLGLIRQEGKHYIVKEGDCIFYKFNI